MANAVERYTQALTNKYLAQINAGRSYNKPAGIDYSSLMSPVTLPSTAPASNPVDQPQGVHKIIDILSQPLYAATQTGKEIAGDIYAAFHQKNAGQGAVKGLAALADIPGYLGNFGTNNQKKTWSDVLRGDPDYLNSFNQRAGINKVVTKENGPLAFHGSKPSTGGLVNDYTNNQGIFSDPNWLPKFIAGLGADIVGDPSTYIGTGLIGGAARAGENALRTTTTGAKIADKVVAGGASIKSAAKSTKLGQDLTKIQRNLGTRLAANLNDAAKTTGEEKAATELRTIDNSVAESRPTTDFGAEQTFGSDFGYQFNAPARAESFVPVEKPREVFDDVIPGEHTPEQLTSENYIQDTVTGQLLKKSDITFPSGKPNPHWRDIAIEGTKGPKYPVGSSARSFLDDAASKLYKSFQTSKGTDEFPAALKAVEQPVEDVAAMSKSVVPAKMSQDEWLNARTAEVAPDGVAFGQHDLISKSKKAAEDYLRANGLKEITTGDILEAQQYSRQLLKDSYRAAKRATQSGIEAARKATVQVPDLPIYVQSLAQIKNPQALRFLELDRMRAADINAFRGNSALVTERNDLLKSLRAAHADASARLSDVVKFAPALVARRTGEAASREAAAAATRAARATEVARTATQSYRRLSGAALQSFLNRAWRELDPIDAFRLQIAKPEEINKVIAAIKRQKNGGIARYIDTDIKIQKTGRKLTTASDMSDAELARVQSAVDKDVVIQARQVSTTAEELLNVTKNADLAYVTSAAKGDFLSNKSREALSSMMHAQSWISDETTPFVSATGTLRSAEELSVGIGHNAVYNARAMENLFAGIIDANKEEITALRAANTNTFFLRRKFETGRDIYEQIIRPQLREAETFLAANKIRAVATDSQEGIPIFLNQMLDALTTTKAGQAFVYGRIVDGFGWGGDVAKNGVMRIAKGGTEGTLPVSSLMKVAGYLTKMAGQDDAIKLLATSKQYDRLAHELSRVAGNIFVPKEGEFETIARGTAVFANGVRKETPIGKLVKNSEGVFSRVPVEAAQQQGVIDDLYGVLMDPDVLGEMFQHINRNVADFDNIFATNVQSVAEDTVRQVVSIIRDSTGQFVNDDKAKALLFPEKIAARVTDDPTVSKFAVGQARDIISQVVPKADIEMAQTGMRVSTATKTTEDDNRLMQELYNGQTKAEAIENGSIITKPEDLIEHNMQTFIGKSVDFLLNTFVARYGNETLHAAIQQYGSLSGVLSREYMRQLTGIDKLTKTIAESRGLAASEYRSIAQEVFNAIKEGPDSTAALPDDVIELTSQLKKMVDYIFKVDNFKDANETTGLLGTWFRNGYDTDLINNKLEQPRFGLPEDFRFSKVVNGKGIGKAEIAEQWKQWDIKDPIDFLSRMERVTTELATESSIAREGVRLGQVAGLFSTKARPGFIRLNRNGTQHLGDSDIKVLDADGLVKYFPTDGGAFYIHKDMVNQVKRMDQLLEMVKKSNPGFNHFMRQNMDPILAMWKAGMTIWRPGHHVRNIVGDTSLAFLHNGTKNPIYYARALKMTTFKQATLGRTMRGDYGVWDAAAAMQGIHRAAEGNAFTRELNEEVLRLGKPGSVGSTIIANVKIGGKKVKIDAGTVYQAFMDRGVLPDFKKYEDIIDISGQGETLNTKIAKALHFEGSAGQSALKKGHEWAANFSEGRDDFVRLGDGLSMMENGFGKVGKNGWKSIDEMFDSVAARIRQAHPDGSDLTPFEKTFARRLIPFYSWNRKAFPIVLENMLTHPGRFTIYPKAMYDFGKSQGIDLDSLSDPFPEDMIFPDFVTDKMTGVGVKGKDGRYWSFDIGVANADVINTMLANGGGAPSSIAHGLLGMLNPFIKVPIELATGSQLNSVPITDKSDYVDSNLPGFNTINSVFGISPSSLVENLTTGNGLKIDPNRSVEKGNRGGVDESPEYLANWLTGTKLLDTTKPNYITLARLQMIDRMKKGQQP